MRVAITGGTGYIGTALAHLLRANGHEAHAVRRGPASDPRSEWDPQARWVRPGTFAGFDAIVHLSGTSIGAKRWTAKRKREVRESRVQSAQVLVEHLATLADPPKVLVSASATGYYGAGGDAVLTEASPRGEGYLAGLVDEWERALAPAAELGIRVAYARFAPMVARDSELLARLGLPFKLGVGGRIGSGRQWFSWVETRDAARAVEFILQHAELTGPVNVCAPGALTNSDFTRELGRAFHRPTLFPVPAAALRLLFGKELADEALLISQRAYPARLLDAGFRFQHPTMEAALAAHFGRRHEVLKGAAL